MWFLSKMGADTIRMLITENNYSHYYLNTVYSTLHFSVYCHDFLPESPASTERGWGRVSQQDSRSHPLHCVIFFVYLFGFCLWCLFVCLFIICFSEENLSPVFGAAYLLAMWLLGSCLTTLCFTFSLWKKKRGSNTTCLFKAMFWEGRNTGSKVLRKMLSRCLPLWLFITIVILRPWMET